MKNKKVKLIATLFLGVGLTVLHAQEAVPVTGGNASGSGGSVSYSVGQVVYSTNTGTGGSVAQGVQQPFEISIVTALEETEGITLQCSVYPNPSADFVILKVVASATLSIQTMLYQLYDGSGKLLENTKIVSNETRIALSNLPDADYFLKIIQGNKELKTFKIIKN
ncbi:MAG: T9SS type A sorting domain-containing protein [Lentimicrobiaceae bacterium]|jgi:hypothetical protein